MTVPVQRGSDPSLSTVILDNLKQLQTSIDRLSERFEGLDQRFLPLREAENRFGEGARDRADLRAQLQLAKTQHDADIEHLAERISEQARQRRSDRRYALTTSIAGLSVVVGGLAYIVPHLS